MDGNDTVHTKEATRMPREATHMSVCQSYDSTRVHDFIPPRVYNNRIGGECLTAIGRPNTLH